jgi:hypothetical protein
MLQTCPRRWFLYNYARDLPGQRGKDLNTERKLSFWQGFAGQLADDGVTEAIRHFKQYRVWRTDLDDWLKVTAMEYVDQSTEYRDAALAGKPLPSVKRQVLDRYFFQDIPDKAEHRRVLEEARAAVRNFFSTDIPSRIEACQSDELICDSKEGNIPYAIHSDVPVYAAYDFVIKKPDRVTIFDWKTGKVTPQKEHATLEQLHWYALFAIQAWGVAPENIRLAPVFLSANFGYHETSVDPIRLQGIKDAWLQKHREISELIAVHKPLDRLENAFAMTDEIRQCVGCVFRTCEGYERVAQLGIANPVKFAVPGEIE